MFLFQERFVEETLGDRVVKKNSSLTPTGSVEANSISSDTVTGNVKYSWD